MIQGLRTVIYHVTDLDKAKAWYNLVLERGPYFGVIENPHFSVEKVR
jgi:hypothetical protein